MSKGQKRSSKEIRKPKQVKTAAVAVAASGSQVKQAPPSLPTGRAGTKR